MDSSFFFYTLVRRAPMLVIVLIAALVAIVRWKFHPKASLLTILGTILYLLEAVVFTVAFYFLPTLAYRLDLSVVSTRWLYTGMYLIQDGVYAILIVLLVSAALSDRTKTPVISHGTL